MKRNFIALLCLSCGLLVATSSFAQKNITLREDNINEMLKAMTVEEKVSAPAGGLVKPIRELKAFGKTKLLAPGASETLTFEVSAYELASFNEESSAW